MATLEKGMSRNSMSKPIPTVTVKTGDGDDDYVIINEEDYRPSMGEIINVDNPDASEETDGGGSPEPLRAVSTEPGDGGEKGDGDETDDEDDDEDDDEE